MTGETQSKIQKLLYNLSTENYKGADDHLCEILKQKVQSRFNNALETIKNKYISDNSNKAE